jgi:hypothetical protein
VDTAPAAAAIGEDQVFPIYSVLFLFIFCPFFEGFCGFNIF